MCGFAGVIHWDNAPVSTGELQAMAALLKHRGPDEQNSLLPAPNVGLTHCRLKVIDLSAAARQPMTDESGRVSVLFNGEIYNFMQLREELLAAGAVFRSKSDTEVILRAYQRWGKEAIRRLDGMFALAIWDAEARKLLLARDRAGKKPLFYRAVGSCVSFGSEIKALLAHPHVGRQIDETLFPYLFLFGAPPVDKTLYRGILQLPPGSLLELTGKETGPVPETYWRLPEEESSGLSEEQAQRELRELLTEAVRKRLVSDVPLGAFLSGGMDSTLVVGLMSRLLKDSQVSTFSIGFEGDERFNETGFARLAADRFKTRHTPFVIGPQPFSLIEELVRHHDQPFADSSALPTYLLSKLTRSHVTVALSGDGGDELFAGYDRFRAALAAESLPAPAWALMAGVLRPITGRPGLHVRSFPYRLGRFLEAAHLPLNARTIAWRAVIQRPQELLLSKTAPRPPEFPERGTPLAKLLRFNFEEYLPCDLLVKTDRCSMAHGLEVRSPFLDTPLTEWAFRLPDRFKLRAGQGKWILRRAFRDLLPAPILARRKMGFGVPLGAWFRGEWNGPLRDLLFSPQARLLRYVDGKRLQQLVQAHLRGECDAGHTLWLFLTLELWLRQQEDRP